MSPKIAVTPTATDPSLSDPSKWMALVQNDAQLTDFVTKGLGNAASVPGLVDYYKGKVKGQPGANPTEQAGSAAYWNEKFANDPNRTGGSTTLAAAVPAPVTRAPFQPSASSLAAFTPIVIPGRHRRRRSPTCTGRWTQCRNRVWLDIQILAPQWVPNVDPQREHRSRTWDPNTNAPTNTFAGWQWDPKMARYMKSARADTMRR